MLGVPAPTDIDLAGATYTFERGAAKTSGGNGWADVWMRGHFAWEFMGNDPRYTPTTTFETLSFPWPTGSEPVDDPRVLAITSVAKELDEKRRAWSDPPSAPEAELKKRTLTNLYNERPTWLRNLHARLDRAAWDAYGWPVDEVPGAVEEEILLERLLVLNGVRK